jgi:hypothetical protein
MSSEIPIFTGFGIEIFERNGEFFIRYDAGEIVPKFEEVKVTSVEAARARHSERDAYEVILAHQRLS